MVSIVFQRLEDLPDDLAACYEQHDDHVLVKIRDDLITAEGARALSELAEQCLSAGWQPKQQLRLVVGGRG